MNDSKPDLHGDKTCIRLCSDAKGFEHTCEDVHEFWEAVQYAHLDSPPSAARSGKCSGCMGERTSTFSHSERGTQSGGSVRYSLTQHICTGIMTGGTSTNGLLDSVRLAWTYVRLHSRENVSGS